MRDYRSCVEVEREVVELCPGWEAADGPLQPVALLPPDFVSPCVCFLCCFFAAMLHAAPSDLFPT